MRLARSSGTVVVALAIASLGCDRIQELKDRFSSSSKSSGGADADVEAIRSLYDASRYDEALQKIQTVVQQNPGSADLFYYQGLCHLAKAGQVDAKAPWSEEEAASLSSFERALSINPRHALSSVGIGDLYARRVAPRRRRGGGDAPDDPYTLALASYQKAVTVDPKLPQAQFRYALFLERTGQLDLAEGAYKAAVEAAATVPEIAPDYYMAYGRFLAGAGNRLDEAIDQFELAKMFRSDDLAIQQEIAIVHSRVGLRHLEKEEYLLAEESLKKAEAMFPDKSIPDARKTEEALQKLRTIRRR